MKDYTVKHSEDRVLTFKGELLGSAADRPMGCQGRTKWNEIDIYRTERGTYVVVMSKQSLWQGEEKAFSCESPQEVLAVLETHSRGQEEDNFENAAEMALREAAGKDEGLSAFL